MRLYHRASRNRELWILRSESLKRPSWDFRSHEEQPQASPEEQKLRRWFLAAMSPAQAELWAQGRRVWATAGSMELPQWRVKEKRAPGADCYRPGRSERWLRAEHHTSSPRTSSGRGEREGSRGSAGCSPGAGPSPLCPPLYGGERPLAARFLWGRQWERWVGKGFISSDQVNLSNLVN